MRCLATPKADAGGRPRAPVAMPHLQLQTVRLLVTRDQVHFRELSAVAYAPAPSIAVAATTRIGLLPPALPFPQASRRRCPCFFCAATHRFCCNPCMYTWYCCLLAKPKKRCHPQREQRIVGKFLIFFVHHHHHTARTMCNSMRSSFFLNARKRRKERRRRRGSAPCHALPRSPAAQPRVFFLPLLLPPSHYPYARPNTHKFQQREQPVVYTPRQQQGGALLHVRCECCPSFGLRLAAMIFPQLSHTRALGVWFCRTQSGR